MTELTTAQKLALIRDCIGQPIYLRPYETVEQIVVNEKGCSVTLDVYRFEERRYEILFTAHGKRMRAWVRTDEDTYVELDPITVWDEDWTPTTERIRGHSLTEAEYADRRDWEAMTHRPGNRRTPLDSCQRTLEDSGTEGDKMYRYWVGHSRHLPHTSESDNK